MDKVQKTIGSQGSGKSVRVGVTNIRYFPLISSHCHDDVHFLTNVYFKNVDNSVFKHTGTGGDIVQGTNNCMWTNFLKFHCFLLSF